MERARPIAALALVVMATLLATPARAQEPRGLLPEQTPATAPSPQAAPPAPQAAPPVPTELPKNLGEVEERLNDLEYRIRRREKKIASYQLKLSEISGEVASQAASLDEIRDNLDATSDRVASSEARVADLKQEIARRARSLYKRGGPLEMIGVLVGSDSMRDFVSRVGYATAAATHDEDLLNETRDVQSRLGRLKSFQTRLVRDRTDVVKDLQERQGTISDVFAKQQSALARIAIDRAAVLAIADVLTGRVGADRISALRRVAGGGMTITYEDWARELLTAIGAPVNRNNLVVVVAWQAAEGTQATWNPLATTMPAEAATVFNEVGVRNFSSLEVGIDATIRTLSRRGHGYDKILDGLERSLAPMETGHWIQQSNWCHGCAEGGYVVGLIPAVEQYYDGRTPSS